MLKYLADLAPYLPKNEKTSRLYNVTDNAKATKRNTNNPVPF